MIEAQTTVAGTEPVLMNALAVGGGAFVLWMAHAVLEMRDGVRSLKQAIFGEPDASEPEGMKVDVTETKRVSVANTKAIEDHITEEMTWREQNSRNVNDQNNRIHNQLSRIERKLGIEEV